MRKGVDLTEYVCIVFSISFPRTAFNTTGIRNAPQNSLFNGFCMAFKRWSKYDHQAGKPWFRCILVEEFLWKLFLNRGWNVVWASKSTRIEIAEVHATAIRSVVWPGMFSAAWQLTGIDVEIYAMNCSLVEAGEARIGCVESCKSLPKLATSPKPIATRNPCLLHCSLIKWPNRRFRR